MDNEYDVIPNKWLRDGSSAFFPTAKPMGTVNRLVRHGSEPEADWDIIKNIEVIKRDYDNYERSLTDMVRLQRGLPSMSASENEDRGRGKRKAKRRSEDTTEPETSLNSSCQSSESPQVHSKRVHVLLSSPVPSTSAQMPSPPIDFVNQTIAFQQRLTEVAITTKCPLPSGQYHHCAFQNETINLLNLGRSACLISRSIEKMSATLKGLKSEVSSLYQLQTQTTDKRETVERTNHEQEFVLEEDILRHFPIKTIEDLNLFEEKLSSEQAFCNAVITALETQVEKSSENKTARSFVRLTMAPTLLQKFSWKGQKRKDRAEKKAFVELKLYQLMLRVLKKIWKIPNMQRVEASVSNYIAHIRTAIPNVEEPNFEIEDEPFENL